MTSKLQWGVVGLVGLAVGCQTGSSPNMTLLEGRLQADSSEAAPTVVASEPTEPVMASYRSQETPPARPTASTGSAVMGFPAASETVVKPGSVTKADVINWTNRGVPDEIIVDRLARSRTVFQLTAADQNELEDKGVSKAVIRAMREMWRR